MSNKRKAEEEVFKGEKTCQSAGCGFKAYFKAASSGAVLCGRHSNRIARSKLRENPVKKQAKADAKTELLDAARAACTPGRVGSVIVRKKTDWSTPTERGFFTVLPNEKAGAGGELVLGMRNLSPKVMGPVNHGQPGLPPALNLENLHQFNKVFPHEVDAHGNPGAEWARLRLKGYTDPVPHRHKFGTKAQHIKKIGLKADGNPNVPLFSVFVGPDRVRHRYSYVESRVFYCTFYERIASKLPEFARLVDLLYNKGANLLIAGFDGRHVDPDGTAADIQRWYDDPELPFGHEMVLYTMLKLHKTPAEFPWRKVQLQHTLPAQ